MTDQSELSLRQPGHVILTLISTHYPLLAT